MLRAEAVLGVDVQGCLQLVARYLEDLILEPLAHDVGVGNTEEECDPAPLEGAPPA